MQVTLEQVDQVRDRTGATYKEAKDALETTGGDVLEAIVLIEQQKSDPHVSGMAFGQDIINGIKDIIKKGNVTKIYLEKDSKIIVDIPLNVGAIGAVFFAPATVVAVIAALATGCELKIVKEDGEVINVKNITKDALDQIKEKLQPHVSPEESNEESQTEDDAKESEDIFEDDDK